MQPVNRIETLIDPRLPQLHGLRQVDYFEISLKDPIVRGLFQDGFYFYSNFDLNDMDYDLKTVASLATEFYGRDNFRIIEQAYSLEGELSPNLFAIWVRKEIFIEKGGMR